MIDNLRAGNRWLPAHIRIAYYQKESAYNYKRARMLRNANRKSYVYFAKQAAIDSARAREMLFALIDNNLPANYEGYL